MFQRTLAAALILSNLKNAIFPSSFLKMEGEIDRGKEYE